MPAAREAPVRPAPAVPEPLTYQPPAIGRIVTVPPWRKKPARFHVSGSDSGLRVSLGMLMATQLNRVAAHIQHLGTAITGLAVLAALIVFFLRLRKRLKYGDPMKELHSQKGPSARDGTRQ